jgi:hypothetical protein
MIIKIRPIVDKKLIFNSMAKTNKNKPNAITASSFAGRSTRPRRPPHKPGLPI